MGRSSGFQRPAEFQRSGAAVRDCHDIAHRVHRVRAVAADGVPHLAFSIATQLKRD